MRIIYHHQIESTNTLSLELARQGAEPGTVVWAGRQRRGRGQYEREFASPPGGLYFSLLLAPDLPQARLSMVTLAAGLGCALAVDAFCGLSVRLKWPNDLYVGGKKLGGILTEAVPDRQNDPLRVVVGVGINVNSRPDDFPPSLADRLTSVRTKTGKTFSLSHLLERCCHAIINQVGQLKEEPDKFLANWDSRDYCKGRLLRWQCGDDIVTGVGRGIMADGRYSLAEKNGCGHAVLAGTLQPLLNGTK